MDIEERTLLSDAADLYRRSEFPLALTGAGLSVDCGIPDFRSPGGLWSVFDPEEYATIDAFLKDPDKAWVFYRELGKVIAGKRPGPAHKALAELEANGKLSGVITQNIDGLHQAAGSQKVYEVHGNCRRLECIQCKSLKQLDAEVLEGDFVPLCEECRFPLKPNVVLFGEAVHEMDRVTDLVRACDRLLVVGTSASVYPIAGIPSVVQGSGGKTFEFNLEETRISFSSDFCLRGRTDEVLPDFVECVLRH